MRTTPCVLLVDDDIDLRSVIKSVLELDGYQVQVASNGQEALDFLKKPGRDPCIMLLDLAMPIMNGLELLHALHETDVAISLPIVIHSAAVRFDAPDEYELLRKPYSIDSLLRVVHRYCGEAHHKKEEEEKDS